MMEPSSHQLVSPPQPRITRGQPPLASSADQPYEEWRHRFMSERLVVLYYLGLIANPVFIAADWLLYRPHLEQLLKIRAILEGGL